MYGSYPQETVFPDMMISDLRRRRLVHLITYIKRPSALPVQVLIAFQTGSPAY